MRQLRPRLLRGLPAGALRRRQLFTIPTLVLHGDSDTIVPFEVSGRRTAEAIDGSKLVLIPDAPHGLNVTHAQTFNAEVLAFLRG
ncbi:MAG: alpha/beta hydrolase [Pseudonocardiaceae bacterium]